MPRRNTIIQRIKNSRKSKKIETTQESSCEQSFYDPDKYLESFRSLSCPNSIELSPTPSINSLSSNDSILDYCVKIK